MGCINYEKIDLQSSAEGGHFLGTAVAADVQVEDREAGRSPGSPVLSACGRAVLQPRALRGKNI